MAPGPNGAISFVRQSSADVPVDRQHFIDLILDHYQSPRNKRPLPGADVIIAGGQPGCGDLVTLYACVDDNGAIRQAAFQGEGCTISQAGASLLTELVVGLTIDEVRDLPYDTMIEHLGRQVVSSRQQCAMLALGTLKLGINQTYRSEA